MEIKKTATAGTLESSDIMVTVEQGEAGIQIDLQSTVMKQYGNKIREVIAQTLQKAGITHAKVTANDRGALDCTIKARVMAACYRGADSTDYKWEE